VLPLRAFPAFRAIATALALLLAADGVTGCGHGPAAIGPAADSTAAPDALAATFNADVSAIAPEAYDLDAAAKTLPAGIDAALSFARDKIRAESYSGVLYGATGAYANRAANSADRSLVLAHVLQAQNVVVRFASCQLSSTAAETLAAQVFAVPASGAGAASASTPNGDAFLSRVFARGERDYAAVRGALGGAAGLATMTHDALITELEDHTWVQAQQGTNWVDLDPSFPDATTGKSYCSASSTADAPPDSEMQHVAIRVGVETLSDGALSETTLLDQTLPASQLLDSQIYLIHAPGDNGALLPEANNDQFAPELLIDGAQINGTAFHMSDGAGSGGGGGLGFSGGLSGGLTGGGGASSAAPGGPYFVGEWLEVAVSQPNGHTGTSRRFIYDRADAAWRASTAHDPKALAPLLTTAQGPVAAQSVHQICIDAGGHDVRSYAAAMAALSGAISASPATSSASNDIGSTFWPFGLHNLAFGILSDRRIVPSLASRPDVRFYSDSPRVFVFGMGPSATVAGAQFIDSDLRRDSIRGISRDPAAASDVADGLLRFGALEGALEAEFMAPPQSLRTSGDTYAATSDLLVGDGLTVLRPGADLSGVGNAKTAAQLKDALSDGATLVVPNGVLHGGAAGWWQIAADGSSVRDVLGDGSGGVYFGLPGNAYVNGNPGVPTWEINPDFSCTKICGRMGPPRAAGRSKAGNEYQTVLTIAMGTIGIALLASVVISILIRRSNAEVAAAAP
jgi:uncharacterized membrane protein YgcG